MNYKEVENRAVNVIRANSFSLGGYTALCLFKDAFGIRLEPDAYKQFIWHGDKKQMLDALENARCTRWYDAETTEALDHYINEYRKILGIGKREIIIPEPIEEKEDKKEFEQLTLF